MARTHEPGLPPPPRASAEWVERVQVMHELVPLARARLDDNIWGYLTGGAETEAAVRRNRLAIDSLALRPRLLNDVSQLDLSRTLFGAELELPVILAPIGSLESFDSRGGAAAAKAAARAGAAMCLSSVSKPGLEAVAQASDGAKIFQLYVRGGPDWIDERVARARGAGYEAFCLTVDTALYSRRERDIAARFVKPWRTAARGQEFQSSLNWADVERFKQQHDMALILKGIMTPEDAEIAAGLGVDGIWVSNHGGRQLDQVAGTTAVLPEIVAAVDGHAKIIVDGGFWRGTDVLKAVALGADAVAVGRLTGLALAAGGEEALVRALDLLYDEMWTALGLLGARCLDDLTADRVQAAPATLSADVLGAFPLLAANLEGDQP